MKVASKGVWGLRAKLWRIRCDRPALASTGRSTPTAEGTGGWEGSFKRWVKIGSGGSIAGLACAQALVNPPGQVNRERWPFTRPGGLTKAGDY